MDADYARTIPLMVADFAMHHHAHPHLFKVGPAVNYDESKFQSLLAGPESAVWVAEQGGEIVGLAAVLLKEWPETLVALPARVVEIDYITVAGAARRQGVGRALANMCVAWAAERQAKSVVLNVFRFNENASAFYNALGFSTLYHRMSLPISH